MAAKYEKSEDVSPKSQQDSLPGDAAGSFKSTNAVDTVSTPPRVNTTVTSMAVASLSCKSENCGRSSISIRSSEAQRLLKEGFDVMKTVADAKLVLFPISQRCLLLPRLKCFKHCLFHLFKRPVELINSLFKCWNMNPLSYLYTYVVLNVFQLLNTTSMTQRALGNTILGLSQASVSDLLCKCRPWDQISGNKPRESYVRLKLWVDSVRLASGLSDGEFRPFNLPSPSIWSRLLMNSTKLLQALHWVLLVQWVATRG